MYIEETLNLAEQFRLAILLSFSFYLVRPRLCKYIRVCTCVYIYIYLYRGGGGGEGLGRTKLERKELWPRESHPATRKLWPPSIVVIQKMVVICCWREIVALELNLQRGGTRCWQELKRPARNRDGFQGRGVGTNTWNEPEMPSFLHLLIQSHLSSSRIILLNY